MTKRTALITAGTSGVGLEIAKMLATEGFKVAVTGRNAAKGKAAVKEIEKQTNERDSAFYFSADHSMLSNMKPLVHEVNKIFPHLDILVNNAGGGIFKKDFTSEKIEYQLALNFAVPFHLTNLISELLIKSSAPQVINITSALHFFGNYTEKNFLNPLNFDPGTRYLDTKLVNLIWTYQLSEKLKTKNIRVNAADPGFSMTDGNTQIFRDYLKLPEFAVNSLSSISTTLDLNTLSASSSHWLATSPKAETITGKYISPQGLIVNSSPQSKSKLFGKMIWEMGLNLVEKAHPKS